MKIIEADKNSIPLALINYRSGKNSLTFEVLDSSNEYEFNVYKNICDMCNIPFFVVYSFTDIEYDPIMYYVMCANDVANNMFAKLNIKSNKWMSELNFAKFLAYINKNNDYNKSLSSAFKQYPPGKQN